jgi:hypothetical protein
VPALPVVANVIKVVMSYEYGSKVAENVTHWRFAGGTLASAEFLTAVATAASDTGATLAPLYGGDCTFQGATALDLSSDTGGMAEVPNVTPGTRVGIPLPANAAALASYNVSRRYRGGHARQYLPWGTAPDLDTPQDFLSGVAADFTIGWGSWCGSVLAAAAGGFTITSQVQIGYRPVGPVPKTSVVIDNITFSLVQQEVASMRRRDGRH